MSATTALAELAVAFAAAAFIAVTLTPVATRIAWSFRVLDQPDERKVHAWPVPRLGGVAVVVSAALAILLTIGAARSVIDSGLLADPWLLVGTATLAIFALGCADDVRGVGSRTKLVVELAAALAVTVFARRISAITLAPIGPTIELGPAGPILAAVWIVAVTNAVNMSDGLNGLAAGLSAVAAAALALSSFLLGETAVSLVLAATAGALVGFLPQNGGKARIFLGDSGSLTIGFLLGTMSVIGLGQAGTWRVLPAALALTIPLIDLAFAVLRRTLSALVVERRDGSRASYGYGINGMPSLFSPDRRHVHHRLMELGLSTRGTVLALYGCGGVMGVLAICSILWPHTGAIIALLVVAAGVYVGPKWLYDEMRLLRNGTLLPVLHHRVIRDRRVHAGFDALAVAASIVVATMLMSSAGGLQASLIDGGARALRVVPITVFGFWLARLYRGAYRHAGISEALLAIRAVVFGTVLGSGCEVVFFGGPSGLALWVLHLFFVLTLVVGARFSLRLLSHVYQRGRRTGKRVLIYGAGRRGDLVLREILSNPDREFVPVGFVDDEPRLWSKTYRGYRVCQGREQLDRVIKQMRAEALVISTDKIPDRRLTDIVRVCQRNDVSALRFGLTWVEDGHPPADARLRAHPSSVLQLLTTPANRPGAEGMT